MPVLVRQVERRHRAGFGAAGLGTAQSWFCSRHKAGFGAVGLGSAQSPFWSRHKAGLGAAGYKTGLVSRQVLNILSKLQNWICPKTGQYKTCIVPNTKIDFVCVYIYIFFIYIIYINIYIYSLYIKNIYIKKICIKKIIYIYVYTQSILEFGTMQVLYCLVLGRIQFCSLDRRCKTCIDTKPVL